MKIKAEITAYYPSDEGAEGGYYDALGNLFNPDYNTCACPKEIPFHAKIKIGGTILSMAVLLGIIVGNGSKGFSDKDK